jgi:hypothetical protein
MSSGKYIAWIAMGIMVSLIIAALLSSEGTVNWYARYQLSDEHPYGVSFIHQLLEEQAGKEDLEVLKDPFDLVFERLDTGSLASDRENYLYLYLGYDRNYDNSELAALLDFVEAGNIFFMASEYVNTRLIDTLMAKNCRTRIYSYAEEDDELPLDTTDAYSDSSAYGAGGYTAHHRNATLHANFRDAALCTDSGYVFYYFFKTDTLAALWTYFSGECLFDPENRVEALGFILPGMDNFIRIPWGRGFFYLHTNPEVFTNVELLDRARLEYAEKVFAYLPTARILWDDYSTPADMSWDLNSRREDNPLSYILSEAPLRWSMYLVLIGALLFIAFRAKRRQQYIPVIEPNANTSLEYVEMLGQLYFEQKNHRYMAAQMWRQFTDYVRTHYYISPSEMEAGWMEKLAVKSAVDPDRISGIARAYTQAGRPSCTAEDLLNLYDKLKFFYSVCK